MTGRLLGHLRFVLVPAAVVLVIQWLLLPSRLELADSTETTVVAFREDVKQQRKLRLITPTFQHFRVDCVDAIPICRNALRDRNIDLRVWLQTPGFLLDPWLVAAEHEGRMIVTPQSQAGAWRNARIVYALGALFVAALAFTLCYFAPFDKQVDED